jgi:hypothetical protein
VMHFGRRAADEIDRVMIGIAAHEDEEVADPIRHPETHPRRPRRCGRA